MKQRINNGRYAVEIKATEDGSVNFLMSDCQIDSNASNTSFSWRQATAMAHLILEAAERAEGFDR